jgi:hypothetical protein
MTFVTVFSSFFSLSLSFTEYRELSALECLSYSFSPLFFTFFAVNVDLAFLLKHGRITFFFFSKGKI